MKYAMYGAGSCRLLIHVVLTKDTRSLESSHTPPLLSFPLLQPRFGLYVCTLGEELGCRPPPHIVVPFSPAHPSKSPRLPCHRCHLITCVLSVAGTHLAMLSRRMRSAVSMIHGHVALIYVFPKAL